jgi:hypothetical protein
MVAPIPMPAAAPRRNPTWRKRMLAPHRGSVARALASRDGRRAALLADL